MSREGGREDQIQLHGKWSAPNRAHTGLKITCTLCVCACDSLCGTNSTVDIATYYKELSGGLVTTLSISPSGEQSPCHHSLHLPLHTPSPSGEQSPCHHSLHLPLHTTRTFYIGHTMCSLSLALSVTNTNSYILMKKLNSNTQRQIVHKTHEGLYKRLSYTYTAIECLTCWWETLIPLTPSANCWFFAFSAAVMNVLYVALFPFVCFHISRHSRFCFPY